MATAPWPMAVEVARTVLAPALLVATIYGFVSGCVLRWRVRARLHLRLPYRKALWLALKAAWTSVAVSYAAVLTTFALITAFVFVFHFPLIAQLVEYLGIPAAPIAGTAARWLVLAHALRKLSSDSRAITSAEARALSANVLAYSLVSLIGVGLGAVLLFELIVPGK